MHFPKIKNKYLEFYRKSSLHIEKKGLIHTIRLLMQSALLENILPKLPSLRGIVEKYGEKSIFSYAQENYQIQEQNSELFYKRKTEFIGYISKYVATDYPLLAPSIEKSLSTNYAVSTAEHHGPLGHPFFFQSALLRWVVFPDLIHLNLCTSHVSLWNSSYPRGIVFHGDGENAPKTYLHLPFFSSKYRMRPVFHLQWYTQEDIEEHSFKKLQKYLAEEKISHTVYEKISEFLKNFVLHPEIIREKTYSAQITRLNNLWWQHLFPQIGSYIPLDSEEIVRTMLLEHLSKETLLSWMLTNTNIQSVIEENFNGISCCFDRRQRRWTYLFWYLDDKNMRHALWRENDALVTSDGAFRCSMNQEEYVVHLANYRLIPSGLLVYTTLACYYWVTCFGGFAQGAYLPKIRLAYESLIKAYGNHEENLCQYSSILNEDMVFLLWNTDTILTALDMMFQGVQTPQEMLEFAKKMSIYSSLSYMSSEIQRCL